MNNCFPKDPELLKKWIDACGRKDKNWYPKRHAHICSLHFEENLFQPYAKSRRLFPGAVPTLKLRLVFSDADPLSASDNEIAQNNKIETNKELNEACQRRNIKRYKVQIEKYKKTLQLKKMHIRKLQKMVIRYRKKNSVMKNILTALRNENAVDPEHVWLLDADFDTITIDDFAKASSNWVKDFIE